MDKTPRTPVRPKDIIGLIVTVFLIFCIVAACIFFKAQKPELKKYDVRVPAKYEKNVKVSADDDAKTITLALPSSETKVHFSSEDSSKKND